MPRCATLPFSAPSFSATATPPLTLDSGRFGEDNTSETQTIDEFGRLVPNTTQFPSAAQGQGFKPVADKVHSHGLEFGIWIMRGVRRMGVEAKSPVKGTAITCGT